MRRFACSQDEVKRTGETGVEETILEGHLGVTKELLAFQTPEKKYYIGCENGGANLIKVQMRRKTPEATVQMTGLLLGRLDLAGT